MENKMSLYQINNEMQLVEDLMFQSVDEETGEIDQDLANKFNELQISKDNKIQGCIYTIKKYANFVKEAKEEIDRIKKLIDKAERIDKTVRKVLVDNLEVGKKYDYGTVAIGWRKSESVNTDNMEIPEDIKTTNGFFDVKTTYTPNKTRIKEALKNGEEVEGAYLDERQNLQIK